MFVNCSGLDCAMPSISLSTPIGHLTVDERERAIVGVRWADEPQGGKTPLLREAARQLEAYFAGGRTDFDLPLAATGTAFDQRVRAAMRSIPYGETRTYGDLAHFTDSGYAARQ